MVVLPDSLWRAWLTLYQTNDPDARQESLPIDHATCRHHQSIQAFPCRYGRSELVSCYFLVNVFNKPDCKSNHRLPQELRQTVMETTGKEAVSRMRFNQRGVSETCNLTFSPGS